MPLWDTLTGWIDKDRQHFIYHPLPPERVDRKLNPDPLEANRHYVRVRLAEMFLKQQVSWFKNWYPAVHSLVKFDFGQQQIEIPNLADAARLGIPSSGQGDIVARNFMLTPTIPFNGGTLSLNAGLIAMEGENYLNNLLKVLGNFAGLLNISQLSTALSIAQPLATGIQDLFGAGNNRLHLGFHNAYAAGELQDGYLAIIRAPETEVDTASLWVVGDQLRRATGTTTTAPFAGYDYLLLRVEVFEKRDDWERLTAIQEPFQEAIRMLHDPATETQALFHLRTAMLRARQTPELTGADRRRVVESLKEQFEKTKQELGILGAVSGAPPTLKQAMKSSLPVKRALSQGEPTEEEIFAATASAANTEMPSLDRSKTLRRNSFKDKPPTLPGSRGHKIPEMMASEPDPATDSTSFEAGAEPVEAMQSAEPPEEPKLHFRLEGEAALGNQVKLSADVDLVFAYDQVTQPVLGVLAGEQLTKIRNESGALGVTIIPKGFTIRDGVWRQTAQFSNGQLDAPLRFQLKAANEPIEDSGVHIIFDKAGAVLYEFHLAIALVTELRPAASIGIATPELNLDELMAVKEDPRTARLLLWMEGDKINYSYINQDSLEQPLAGEFKKITRTSLADKLGKIRSMLQPVTDHIIWSLIGYRIDDPQSAGEKKAFGEAMERMATAGSSLYFALAEDEDFKQVLDALNALAPGSRLSIYTDCAFLPWEILYPHRYNIGWSDEIKKANPIQVQNFWGYRFAIECLLKAKGTYKPPFKAHQTGQPFISYNLNPTIDQAFAGAGFQPVLDQETWAGQLDKSKCKVEVKKRGADILSMLQTPGYEATMIYLYCHGSNDHPFQDNQSELLELDTGVSIDPEVLTDGSTFKCGPIVFLNSCSSGAFSPLSFSSFLSRFREKEALGLIASNFPVPATFAAKFGGNIIQNYLQPPTKTIGDVLLQERRRLLDHNNPLGLFYSLQCPMGITARAN